MRKLPHHKAYEYTYQFTDINGKRCIARNYIAIVPGVDISTLVRRWNMACKMGSEYKLIQEVDLMKAVTTPGLNGSTIAKDWQLLDHMQFHSTTISITDITDITEI